MNLTRGAKRRRKWEARKGKFHSWLLNFVSSAFACFAPFAVNIPSPEKPGLRAAE